MIVGLSYVFAVIITAVLACVLYPIAAVFWFIGLLGKLGEMMFGATNHIIKKMWADITSKKIVDVTKQNDTSAGENTEAPEQANAPEESTGTVNLKK